MQRFRATLALRMLMLAAFVASASALLFVRFEQESVPLLVFKSRAVEIGTLPPNSHREIAFVLCNSGTSDLLLSGLKESCGCSPASLSTEIVPPGEQATLTVNFRAPHEPGEFAHTIWFDTNDPKNTNVHVTFSGRADWPVEVEPPSINAHAFVDEEIPPTTIEIYSRTDQPFELKKIESSNWIHVMPTNEATDALRKRFTVQMDPTAEAGTRLGSIRFELSTPERPSLIVPVRCSSGRQDPVRPDICFLKPTQDGARKTADFVVTSRPDVKLEITRIEGDAVGWQVESWSKVSQQDGKAAYRVFFVNRGRSGYIRSTASFFSDEQLVGSAIVCGLATD